MMTLVQGGGRLPWRAAALALGIWASRGPTTVAAGDVPAPPERTRWERKSGLGLRWHGGQRRGTLGYGPPGLHPGFQGFGLGFHPGYGYGGDGLGVGAEGGYPFYGGPGYPHPWPQLRRLGGINPFAHYGGPGGPSPGHPNYFGGVGPLVADVPVVTIGGAPGEADYASGYGPFTGAIPYPETALAPFTSAAAAGGSASGVVTSNPSETPANTAPVPGPGQPSTAPPAARGAATGLTALAPQLEIDTVPIVDADGARGLKVTAVYPGSPAERAGLRVGDVIRSINGYQTAQTGNLVWIITNAAPDNVLRMTVRTAADGKEHAITARLP